MKQQLASVTESKSKISSELEMKLLAFKEKQRLELLAYEQSLLEENCATEDSNVIINDNLNRNL